MLVPEMRLDTGTGPNCCSAITADKHPVLLIELRNVVHSLLYWLQLIIEAFEWNELKMPSWSPS
jgi:hypothetical protein